MRTGSIATAAYTPGPAPESTDNLRGYLEEELIRVSAAITALAAGHLDAAHVAPTKPRAGDVRYADGTDWNPGSGEGIYFYNAAGTWVKL